MAIKFGGEFEIKRTPEEVYDFLTDPNKFAPLLPDFQGMTQQDATHFTVKVKGGKVAMTAGFDLAPAGTGTKVVWQGEAQVFGALASVAGGLLEPLGRKNVQKLIDGLQTALS